MTVLAICAAVLVLVAALWFDHWVNVTVLSRSGRPEEDQ